MIGPGIYYGVSAAQYHADPCEEPSLSSGIVNLLLAKTPTHARLSHPRLNPTFFKEPPNSAMTLGSAAHEILLGKGGGIEIIDAPNWRKRKGFDAPQRRRDAIAAGLTPVLPTEYAVAKQIADAVLARVQHVRGAERAFRQGTPEVVAVWRDGGVMCRAMVDWLDGGSVFDLKTTGAGLSDRALQSKIAGGLDVQAAFYLRGLEAVTPDEHKFYWVFVENEPPFESRVIEMHGAVRAEGDRKCSLAIETWGRCLEASHWPGYSLEIERLEEEIHV
jgi:hypothetical protein